jgi:hypothetical protein
MTVLDEGKTIQDPKDARSAEWADRGWWLAVEYGVVTKQQRFEKKLVKLRKLGSMKELLEPGGRIVYRNLFREEDVRDAWTLLCELTPWKAQLRCYLNGEEVPFKDASAILWCAGFLKDERPCRGVLPTGKGAEKRAHAWAIGCDRKISIAPTGFDEKTEERRHILTFSRVDERGMLVFDREAIAAWVATGVTGRRCPLSPGRDPAKLAAIFKDLSARALGWPVVLEMQPALKKRLGSAALEAEHGFVAKKGAAALGEYENVELRWADNDVEVRRATELRGSSIARHVRLPKKVIAVLESGARVRGVRIEEGYVKLAELGGRYEVEQRFVLATRFHLGLADDATKYEGYDVVTVPRATPEYEQWAALILDEVP